MFGISAALTTPFSDDGSVNFIRLNTHIKTVLSEGCTSVTLFGTTGEGPSVTWDERLATLRAAIDGGIRPDQIVLGLHGVASADITKQTNAALELGVKFFLLPPPCYFNDPSNDGLFAWYDEILSQIAGSGAKFILYHIPQVIGVGLPIDLVKQVKASHPDIVYGVKDSSGSFSNTQQLLQLSGLEILVGDERQLAASAKIGASGAISGIANLFSGRLAQVLTSATDDPQINHLVDTALMFPVIPAIKALVAHKYGAPEWRKTAAPLVATPDPGYATLCEAYDQVIASA